VVADRVSNVAQKNRNWIITGVDVFMDVIFVERWLW